MLLSLYASVPLHAPSPRAAVTYELTDTQSDNDTDDNLTESIKEDVGAEVCMCVLDMALCCCEAVEEGLIGVRPQ